MNYDDFLASKHVTVKPSGFEVAPGEINTTLFPFQRDIVRWAVRLGRAAIFANVGLGKTAMQLEWARLITEHSKGNRVLILTPLAVAEQTVQEGVKFGITVKHAADQLEAGDAPIVVTNYDRVHRFVVTDFQGVVLDESSILKHYSKTFFHLTGLFKETPFRLCCTATPAPNEWGEFGNHSTFLDILHFKDMLSRWFVGEGDVARVARLKHYARADFWRWLTSWSVCLSKPADLGTEYDMPGYDLPPLHVHEHRLSANQATIDRAQAKGRLMPDTSPSAIAFMSVKRDSLADRVAKAAEIVANTPDTEPIIVWCDTDFEADALRAVLPSAVEVRGSHTSKRKERDLRGFSEGKTRIIITKPELAGHGLNWQHCRTSIFAGLSFSFEQTYQALGRTHRYGQKRDVHAHLIYAETEGNIMQVLKEKQQAFEEMQAEMTAAIREHGLFRDEQKPVYTKADIDKTEGKGWTYHLGDCVQVMPGMPEGSVDLTVTSIPFSNLYVYSDKDSDVGNAANKAEFLEHMRFVIRELYRVTALGRCCAVHVKDLPLFINRDGEMGIDPFSDDVTAAFRKEGWVLQSRITIEKDPVLEMKKTNSHGLLFSNWKEHAEHLRVGLPDYLLVFQKPGAASIPVTHSATDLTYFGSNPPASWRYPTLPSRNSGKVNAALPVWQNYANPNWSDVVVPLVWTDINQTDVLNYLIAKTDKDERHLCPLQLDLIARVIQWKSNPGDVVFDPFGGVASTGYKALEMGRKFVGVELKEAYHVLGLKYLKEAEIKAAAPTLFDWAAKQEVVQP